MPAESIVVPVTSLQRFARLAPLGWALMLFYLGLFIFTTYSALGEYAFSAERQPERLPYLIAMFLSFELLLLLSAFLTGQASIRLHRLRTQSNAEALLAALDKTCDMLLLFFIWMIASITAYQWLMFNPIY